MEAHMEVDDDTWKYSDASDDLPMLDISESGLVVFSDVKVRKS